MRTLLFGKIRARRAIAALIASGLISAGSTACSHSSDASKSKPSIGDAKASKASSLPRDPSANPGDPGPCRHAMNDLMAAGSKITTDPKDKTKTSEALSGVATSLTADAAKIGDPAARQGAQDIAALYGQLAQDAKNGVAPNVKDLQAKVQAATAALGKCSSAEG